MNLILRKNWLRDLIVGIIVSLLVFFFLFFPAIRDSISAYQIESFYIYSDVDYEIPSPDRNQVAEIEDLRYVEYVDPFIRTSAPVRIDGRNVDCEGSVYLVNHNADEWGPYIDSRLLAGEIKGIPGAYVDESFAKVNNVEVGDQIRFKLDGVEFSFPVIAEFETTLRQGEADPSIVLFSNDPSYTELLSEYNYSGAYIGTIDRPLASEYFRNEYKPLGQVGNPEDYASEDLYQSALDFVLNSDYSAVIQSFNDIGTDVLDPASLQAHSRLLFWIGIIVTIGYTFLVYIWRVRSKSSIALWKRIGKLGVFKGHIVRKIVWIGIYESVICLLVTLLCFLISSLLLTGDIHSITLSYTIVYSAVMFIAVFITASCSANKIVGMNQRELEKKEQENLPELNGNKPENPHKDEEDKL